MKSWKNLHTNFIIIYLLIHSDTNLYKKVCPSSASLTTTDVTSLTHDTAIVMAVTNIAIIVGADTILETTDAYNLTTNCFGYVGIEDQKEQKSEIFICPNPAIDFLEFAAEGITDFKNVYISVFNNMGNLILKEKMIQNKTIINLSDFSNGIYFYQIRVNEQLVKANKFIIVK